MRILHLLEPVAGGDESVIACRVACETGDGRIEHRVWIIGSTEAEERAAELGVRTTDRLPAPLGIGEASWRGLARLAHDRLGGRGAPPDVVTCWSIGALGAARLALAGTPAAPAPRVGVMVRPPRRPATGISGRLHQKRLAWALGGATMLTVGPDSRRAWVAVGAGDVRSAPVLNGWHTGAGAGVLNRERLRAELGVEPDETAFGVLAGMPGDADARWLVFGLGLLYTAGCRVAGIVPAGSAGLRRAALFTRLHGRRWTLRPSPWGLERLIAASDVAVWGGTGAGPIGAAMAVAAGIPIVHMNPGEAVAHGASPASSLRQEVRQWLPLAQSARARHAQALACAARWAGDDDDFRRVLTALWHEAAGHGFDKDEMPAPRALAGQRC